MSLPVRGAWIEIMRCHQRNTMRTRRSPCGERGLKWAECRGLPEDRRSLPVRGAWIEIMSADTTFQRCDASLPVRGAWIEMLQSNIKSIRKESLPVRGAWIEIRKRVRQTGDCRRSPCGERGLKSQTAKVGYRPLGRSPCGERGLK